MPNRGTRGGTKAKARRRKTPLENQTAPERSSSSPIDEKPSLADNNPSRLFSFKNGQQFTWLNEPPVNSEKHPDLFFNI